MNSRIREIGENIKNVEFFEGSVEYDVCLKDYTTMKVGGDCDIFIQCSDSKSLIYALQLLKQNKIDYFILGGGSNLIIGDEGFRGAVLGTHRIKNINYNDTDNELYCGSGVTISEIIDFCKDKNLGNLEMFSGLPGTIGGACYMNARCYEKNICEFIKSVEYINMESEIPELNKYIMNENDWSYKKSPFTNKKFLITGVTLNNLKKLKNADDIKMFNEKCSFYVNDRRQKGHFKCPSAGSVFKNNRDFGKPSGKLIDEAGLKGISIGGAQIAPWHGNFIINVNNAKAKDIKDLVELVQKKVLEKTGFLLEPEIIFM